MSTVHEGDASTSRRKQLLMGKNEMNLEALKSRAIELRDQLEQLRLRLQANAAGSSFEALLKELSIIGAHFSKFQSELRPQLQFYVAYPKNITQANCELVPEQLASMPLPEMAAHEIQLLSKQGELPESEQAAATAAEAANNNVRKHNANINQLFAPSQCLCSKSASRKSIDVAFSTIQHEIMVLLRATSASSTAVAVKAEKGNQDSVTASVIAALKAGRI